MSVTYQVRTEAIARPTSARRGRMFAPAGRGSAPAAFISTSPGNYVEVPSALIASCINGRPDLVICFWMRKSVANFNRGILTRVDGSVYQVFLRSTTARFDAFFTSNSRGLILSTAGGAVPETVDGQWHFYAILHQTNTQPRAWIDGVERSGSFAGAAPATLQSLAVNLVVGPEDMDIADLELYCGRGFSDEEVANLYTKPNAPDWSHPLAGGAGLTVVGSPGGI